MAEKISKEVAQELRSEIARVLLDVWDPIGIADEPLAQDEYDAYIGPILELLLHRASDEELMDYLYSVVWKSMGLSPPLGRQDMIPTVAALKGIAIPHEYEP